jgi:hypothetical protein
MHFVHASPFFFCPRGGYSDRVSEPHSGHHPLSCLEYFITPIAFGLTPAVTLCDRRHCEQQDNSINKRID